MTMAGLNPVNLSSLSTVQQSIILVLMIGGNQIVVSAIVVYIRKRSFEKRFKKAAEDGKRKRIENDGKNLPNSPCMCTIPPSFRYPKVSPSQSKTISVMQDLGLTYEVPPDLSRNTKLSNLPTLASLKTESKSQSTTTTELSSPMSFRGIDDITLQDPDPAAELHTISDTRMRCNNPLHNHLLMHGRVDRNAQFHGLSPEEREHVRCVEYQAVRFLSYLVPAYYVALQVSGCIALGLYMSINKASVARENGLNPW